GDGWLAIRHQLKAHRTAIQSNVAAAPTMSSRPGIESRNSETPAPADRTAAVAASGGPSWAAPTKAT
ncbi:MAG: hypothetical protein ACRDJ9_36560, partial [Dehalococcoidia bacterium]